MWKPNQTSGQPVTTEAALSVGRDGDAQQEWQRGPVKKDQEIRRLTSVDEPQALRFLGQEPLRNLIMTGLIRDHGLESPSNRGTFYGCFVQNQLVGMALMGHCILLSGSLETMRQFAQLACHTDASQVHMMLAEEEMTDGFCRYLVQLSSGLAVQQIAPQLMLVLTGMKMKTGRVTGLRRAGSVELDQLTQMNAGAYVELNGVDPASKDPKGFRARVLSRIEMKRIWVLKDEKGVAFKADIVSMTDDAVYLEGIITRSDLRGTGLGSAALSALCRRLLRRHKAVCLFANAENQPLLSFYNRIGFTPFAAHRLVRFTQ